MNPRTLAFFILTVSTCARNQPKTAGESGFYYYTEDAAAEFSVDRTCYHKTCCKEGIAVLGVEDYSIFSANSRKKVVDAVAAAARSGSILQNGTKLSKERFVLTTEDEHFVLGGAPLATIVPVSKASEVAKTAIRTHESILALEIFAEITKSRGGEPHAAAIGVQWKEYNPDGTMTSSGLGQGFCGVIDTQGRVILSMTSELNID